nr:helix-hairpin-helix domain-containing protein [uncultured Campylobacter sp.]
MSLNSIEPMKADAVIEYRKTNKFKSTKDVKNVNGTRYKTYESLRRHVG